MQYLTPPQIIKEKDYVPKTHSKLHDIYQSQLEELSEIDKSGQLRRSAEQEGPSIIIFETTQKGLRCVGEQALIALRTNRNQDLITKAETSILQEKSIGILGMSVGASIAVGTVYASIAGNLRIADADILTTTNLNRLRATLFDVGSNKSAITAQQIWEVNPYQSLQAYKEFIKNDNLKEFLTIPTKLSVIVDEIDDFATKVNIRMQARELGIPVVMFTSLGDSILIDIERFDQEPDREVFHGLLGELPETILTNPNPDPATIQKLAVQLVGSKYVPTRALESLPKIGSELTGRPQLYSTITVGSGLATYILREILLGKDVPSGRHFVKFSELVSLADEDFGNTKSRKNILSKLGIKAE